MAIPSSVLMDATDIQPSGGWIGNAPIPDSLSLESCEMTMTGEEQRDFLEFVRCMLQWRPEDRLTAKQLLEHPWLKEDKSLEPLPLRGQK